MPSEGPIRPVVFGVEAAEELPSPATAEPAMTRADATAMWVLFIPVFTQFDDALSSTVTGSIRERKRGDLMAAPLKRMLLLEKALERLA
jgi:hypothetical protein